MEVNQDELVEIEFCVALGNTRATFNYIHTWQYMPLSNRAWNFVLIHSYEFQTFRVGIGSEVSDPILKRVRWWLEFGLPAVALLSLLLVDVILSA